MAINEAEYIWHNGQLVPWEQATVHVLTHAMHYGSSVFEGVRVYATPDGPRAFRLGDHIKRLFYSAKVYRMQLPYSEREVSEACKQVVTANGLVNGAYIRPLAFRGYGSLGVAPKEDLPIHMSIAAIEWGAYLGADGLEKGVDTCVSSWQRVAPNTIPAGAKAGGNYLSGQLVSMEAKRLGYAEGIALGADGMVSEGAGENLFLVKDGVIYTPPSSASILAGITRDTVIQLAGDLGIEVREQALPREFLYMCDELFFSGTAAEITPIRSVDDLPVGDGVRGPVTEAVQSAFFGLFDGKTRDTRGWLEPLDPGFPKPVAVKA